VLSAILAQTCIKPKKMEKTGENLRNASKVHGGSPVVFRGQRFGGIETDEKGVKRGQEMD